ncbi:MAG: M23 family metallopeptidase [Candidatus Eiseniibacteriota bacterium]|nr:MAG: M23 family metallopeptidase [Candidatus Eisenbacteria bacterium]
MKKRHLTVVIVPDGRSKIRSIRIPVATVKVLAGMLPAIIFFGLFFLGDSMGSLFSKSPLSALKEENLALRARLERISGDLLELRQLLMRNFDFERKARVLAELDPIDEDVRLMGVGGPEPILDDPLAVFDPTFASAVRRTEIEIDELVRQSQLQRESLTEVVTKLEERREIWDHTPSINPVPGGFVSSRFGQRTDPFTGSNSFHEGIDICAPRGTPVLASANGVVTFAGRRAGYGRTICIDHGRGIVTWYAHVGTLNVDRGTRVKRGQVIGSVGTSGRATAPHVHYEVRKNSAAVNPSQYVLPGNVVVD